MQRRAFFTLIIITALVSVGATLGALQLINPQQGAPREILVTFEVVITATPGPTQTPYIITQIPEGVALVPTGFLQTPDLTRSPVPTIDPTLVGASSAIQGTGTALPDQCILHVLQEGDTPFGVALQYGADGFRLMAVNGLTEETATQLRIGDVLIVPLEGCPLEAATPEVPTETPTSTPETSGTPEATEEFTPTPSPSPTITLAPTAANAQLEILEITGRGDVTTEAVKVRNLGNTVNVTGWTLSDAQGNIYTFPEQLIFSNAEVTIYSRSGTNTPVVFFWGRDEAVWGDPGDVITLADADGRIQATRRLS